jgi:hypothetical protein
MPFVSAEPRQVRRAIAVVLGLSLAFAAAGIVAGWLWPARYDLAAFVEEGSIEGKPLVLRPDLLEQLNGLVTAAAAAGELNESPWRVWRRFSVAGEGPMLVIRLRHTDREKGARLLEAARTAIVAELKRRHDRAMAPHAAYIDHLRAQIHEVEASPQNRAARGAETNERHVTASTLRRHLRDAEVLAALSSVPSPVGEIRVREPNRSARVLLMGLSAAFVGFALGVAGLTVNAYRSRLERELAKV